MKTKTNNLTFEFIKIMILFIAVLYLAWGFPSYYNVFEWDIYNRLAFAGFAGSISIIAGFCLLEKIFNEE